MVGTVMSSVWYVYVIRCGDGTSYYTGITTDVTRRLAQHRRGIGARYTRGRGPLELWWVSLPVSHHEALVIERQMKQWSHQEKEGLNRDGGALSPSLG